MRYKGRAAGRRAPLFAAATLAALGASVASAEHTCVELGGAWPEGPLYAVPSRTFYRSVAMHCEDFEAWVPNGPGQGLWQYIVDVCNGLPESGLALEGSLVEWTDSDAEFLVEKPAGEWQQRIGGQPALRRLRLHAAPDNAPSEKVFRCNGIAVDLEADGSLKEEQGAPAEEPVFGRLPLELSLDTSKAYNWMRFPGYLRWAGHMAATIREEGATAPMFADVGGGAGWLSMLMKARLGPEAEVVCTDIDPAALEVAQKDAAFNALEVSIAEGDMMEPLQRKPDFVYFYPPQDADEPGELRGSPDVSVLVPTGLESLHFHSRFCEELEVAPGGVAWLGVNWEHVPAVMERCCDAGWSVNIPERLRNMVDVPSALLELRRAEEPTADCVARALGQARAEAEFQTRAVGAESTEERVGMFAAAAQRGFGRAMGKLGTYYLVEEKDPEGGAEWLERAAFSGYEEAANCFGLLLANADEDENAFLWFLSAAEHGHPGAQASVGMAFRTGAGIEASDTEAKFWLQRAAAQFDTQACVELGEMAGVEGKDVESRNWYLRAAMLGNADSQFLLGQMAALGYGSEEGPNASEAFHWLSAAAAQGQPKAMLLLGDLEKDEVDKERWYRLALEMGEEQAAAKLRAMRFEEDDTLLAGGKSAAFDARGDGSGSLRGDVSGGSLRKKRRKLRKKAQPEEEDPFASIGQGSDGGSAGGWSDEDYRNPTSSAWGTRMAGATQAAADRAARRAESKLVGGMTHLKEERMDEWRGRIVPRQAQQERRAVARPSPGMLGLWR